MSWRIELPNGVAVSFSGSADAGSLPVVLNAVADRRNRCEYCTGDSSFATNSSSRKPPSQQYILLRSNNCLIDLTVAS